MSKFITTIRHTFKKSWFLSFILLVIYLLTKGYKYGWDDQHVEIPLLKSLIDPTLYQGDYYVEALKQNYVSYFYPILSRLITIKQIPAVYLTLYLISRYVFIFFTYKIWKHISGKRSMGFFVTAVFVTLGRVPEFLYRTFSHQEFALAIIAGGLYYFYKERFVLAAAILGLASNFHCLYASFPMGYVGLYMLLNVKRHGIKTALKTYLSFLLFASPVIIWIIQKNVAAYLNDTPPIDPALDWIAIYRHISLQIFIFYGLPFKFIFTNFGLWVSVAADYILLTLLFLLNFFFNDAFRKDKKIQAITLAALIFFAITYVFTYYWPKRFILDLNLVRNVQYLFYFFMGYTLILIIDCIKKKNTLIGIIATYVYCLIAISDQIAMASIMLLAAILLLEKTHGYASSWKKRVALVSSLAFLAISLSLLFWLILRATPSGNKALIISAICVAVGWGAYHLIFNKNYKFKLLIIIVPFIVVFSYRIYLMINYTRQELYGGDFWKLQRDWEDMQHFVQANTPKNALLLVPTDMEMGGFRIYSERKIVCCYRDNGIFGFSFAAGVEWFNRLRDVEPFKVIYDKSIEHAVLSALIKYKVDYIVYMRYYAPQNESSKTYQRIYQNDNFSLFKIKAKFPSEMRNIPPAAIHTPKT